ncbi:MAG: hypothetical protein VX537_02485 [Candidatus Neomarinimicrobiota bacterium]|nr:hypothetical protein [Candidatus Neomarinimicrobiota bacterium]
MVNYDIVRNISHPKCIPDNTVGITIQDRVGYAKGRGPGCAAVRASRRIIKTIAYGK